MQIFMWPHHSTFILFFLSLQGLLLVVFECFVAAMVHLLEIFLHEFGFQSENKHFGSSPKQSCSFFEGRGTPVENPCFKHTQKRRRDYCDTQKRVKAIFHTTKLDLQSVSGIYTEPWQK
jgi:hypothetical protein